MEDLHRLYPIGIQTFSEIREENYLYIDKTEYVYRMTHFSSKYIFLSRPRRFGKSLLTSTLHSYFSGRKELFHGLAIEKLEKEWTEYPVLHFDMSTAKHVDKEQLLQELNLKLANYESFYGKDKEEVNPNQRLMGVIKRAYKQTGKKVVVLIDEYDAPLLDVMHERENLHVLRNIMRNFYSPLKACDPYLRYVFLTGITKFSQFSIFSELNNIKNVSMDEPYAAICGITQDEMLTQMKDDIEQLAKKMDVGFEEVVVKLKENYDGYHFTYPSPDVYNPFSLLNAFADGKFNSYWFGSGTPTYLFNSVFAHVSKTEINCFFRNVTHLLYILFDYFYYFTRDTISLTIVRYIFYYYTTGTNKAVSAHTNTLYDGCPHSDPTPLTNMHISADSTARCYMHIIINNTFMVNTCFGIDNTMFAYLSFRLNNSPLHYYRTFTNYSSWRNDSRRMNGCYKLTVKPFNNHLAYLAIPNTNDKRR